MPVVMAVKSALNGPGREVPPGRSAKPSGGARRPLAGQTTASTLPTTVERGTVPCPASSMCVRESSEVCRSSPRRKRLSRGTVTEKSVPEATVRPPGPGRR